MSDHFQFTRNYNDLSTNKGFQFEFCCDRCGTGFRTKFKSSATGMLTEALDTAGSIFGGLFGQAADVSERVRSAGWQQARDEAFIDAINELQPDFIQCPRCSSWVCRRSCWQKKTSICLSRIGVKGSGQLALSVRRRWQIT